MIQLFHGDCIEEMGWLQSESIDLTITSPPYDSLRSYQNLDFEKFSQCAKELFRITKEGGVVVWVVGDATYNGTETGTSFKQALHFKNIGFNLHDTMIYEKVGLAFPDSNRYYQMFEYMFIFSKGSPKTFNPIKDRQNASAGRKVTGKHRNPDHSFSQRIGTRLGRICQPFGVRFNIWKIPNQKRGIGHPAPSPLQLAEDHIISWSNQGDIVFDPFLGSGTSGIAAKKLGRKFIGIDIEEKYVELAKERIESV